MIKVFRNAPNGTINGITFSSDEDKIGFYLNGIATDSVTIAYISSSSPMPNWIQPGNRYIVGIDSNDNNISFDIFPKINGELKQAIFSSNKYGIITIPDETTNLMIRIHILSGANIVNAHIYPLFLNTLSNQFISNIFTNIQNELFSIKNDMARIVKANYVVDNGYYLSRSGAKNALNGFDYITIDLTNLDGVEIYGYQASSMSGIIFRDLNGNNLADNDNNINHIPATAGYIKWKLLKPDNATYAVTSFSTTNNRIYYIKGIVCTIDPVAKIEMPLADIVMIPIFGQSLSIGAAATPIISASPKYDAGLMFNGGVIAKQKAISFFTDFQPLIEATQETPASGCVEKIVEQIQSENGVSTISEYWNNKHILVVSCGEGSKTIADLMQYYYDGLKNAIQGAKNICDENNLTLNIPCWCWIQGETDQKEDTSTGKTATDKLTYKNALVQLQTNLNTFVKNTTMQNNDIVCICYQSASQNIVATSKIPTYTNIAVMEVPTAQMELVRDNDHFVASTPVYILDHSTEQPIHLSRIGSKMLGLYCGIAAKSIIFDEKVPTGLTPASYSINEHVLTIKYNVPVPPLCIDTKYVKLVTNYGFTLLNSNNIDIISSISIFDDSVIINCSESPLNAMLFYGFNGTAYKDGRIDGARGNICDSADYIFNGEIDGKRYTLKNYAYSFVKLLDANNDII